MGEDGDGKEEGEAEGAEQDQETFWACEGVFGMDEEDGQNWMLVLHLRPEVGQPCPICSWIPIHPTSTHFMSLHAQTSS